MKLTFFRWTLAKCPNLFSIAFSFQEGLLFFNFILLSSFASCDDNHARWSDTCQDFFTDSFSQHKKVRQVAICFILTSFNFNCFKNHCFSFYIVAWKKVVCCTNYGPITDKTISWSIVKLSNILSDFDVCSKIRN